MNTFKPVTIPGTVINEANAMRFPSIEAASAHIALISAPDDELHYGIETDGAAFYVVAYEEDGYRVGAF